MYEENQASHKYVVGKGKSTLTDFLGDCEYSSLILYPKLTNGTFSKVSSNLESETYHLLSFQNFFLLWYIATHYSFFDGPSLMQDFVTSCIGHLENTGSLAGTNLPSIDTFYYTISQESHFINITTDFIKKFSKYWEAGPFTGASFPKLIGNRYCRLLSLKLTSSFTSFLRKFVPDSQVCVCVCVSCFRYSIVIQHLYTTSVYTAEWSPPQNLVTVHHQTNS